MMYDFIEQPNDKLVLLMGGHGRRLWTLGVIRQDRRCRVTQEIIPKGAKCWRPISNDTDRWCRISEKGMRRLIGVAKRRTRRAGK